MPRIKDKLAWVPNFCTLTNLSIGFLSILFVSSSQEEPKYFLLAGILIFVAMLFDGLDGFAARLLNAKSSIGKNLDSLSDLVTFGVAPATLMYMFFLHKIEYEFLNKTSIPIGMLLATIWPACTAYRLARFNVTSSKDSFSGLPSPLAGSLVGLLPIIFYDQSWFFSSLIIVPIFIFFSFMMVSTVRYPKPQVTFLRRFSRGRLFIVLVTVTIIFTFIGFYYGLNYIALVFLTIGIFYIVTGLVSLVIHTIQKYRI